ncbi:MULTISPECIES: MarR family winged helix-turn-helix transcriptional regulator [Sphingobium]|uniref:MarR family winged helix-turn-helix transcriptional regulator n=1 Tax=Sphingobium TaxID=165695 RepID=UPI0015EBD988|nr:MULTISPECIES: MarR family transcriptional regulator [Sphingobium]MCW2362567.1 DNA-binding MarR family transcriptional regulator [Sphingobium sp. B10D3B]MCW2400753.1 DNA-binding MarR family transcriptional regulator [Sphingobium sp. B10D7B]MCW2407732.1 DNA-binding MarR family transcriptional regulator [Sphingobium xanthum]
MSAQSRSDDVRPQRLLYLLKRGYTAGKLELDEVVRAHGLTTSDFTILSFLKRLAPCSAAELARVQRVTPQAATQQLAQLREKNLITSETSELNRRISLISLTPEGQARFEAVNADARRLEEQLTAGLAEQERKTLLDLLTRLVVSMEAKGQSIDDK